MSHRREQLESSLQRALGELIAVGLHDPRIRGLVSVTGVEVSPDNHYATVGISVLPASAQALSIEGLNAAAGHLRAQLGGKLEIRTVPQLRFHADPSLKKQAAILGAIRQAVGEEKVPGTLPAGEEPKP
jgi:ribosome-binding factor A